MVSFCLHTKLERSTPGRVNGHRTGGCPGAGFARLDHGVKFAYIWRRKKI